MAERSKALPLTTYNFVGMSLEIRVSAAFLLVGWPGIYINVWHCGVLSLVLLQQKDPVALPEENGISSRFQVSILSQYDLSC